MADNLLSALRKTIENKAVSIKKVLAKHRNIVTGEEFYMEHSVEASESATELRSVIGGVILDVTESINHQEQIEYLANYDILTDTYNRNYFEKFINNRLPRSYSVIVFDLDGLKLVNDAFGHYEGDKIIKLVANLLKEAFHNSLFVSRIGGDEFVVLSPTIDYDEISYEAMTFEALIRDYNSKNAIEVNVSKGGVTVLNNDLAFDKAFVQAENLMYRRKLNSRSSRKSKALESILETLNAKTEETPTNIISIK